MARLYHSGLTLLSVASIICGCFAVNPGFRTTITNKGLDYVCQVGIPILEKTLSSLTIPDISGKTGTPVGKVEYSLSHIKLTKVKIPTSSLDASSSGITVKASGIDIKASGDWRYREESWPHIKDHGGCEVSVSSVSLSVSVVVGVDSNGHPTLKASDCSLKLGHIDVHFSGGTSWLYNLFSGSIEDTLKGYITDEVCKEAKDEINKDGNKALESLPVVVKIDDVSEVDYTLLSTPKYTSSYFETNHKGEFYAIAKHQETPFTPTPLPAVKDTGKMAYVWLTEYIADTAGFVYQQAGVLNYNVTPNMVPKGFVFQLNTTSFKSILPNLYNAYPNMAMTLGLVTVKPPNLDISSNGAKFTIPGQVKVFVKDSKKNATVLAFTLGAMVYADVKMWVHSSSNREIISTNATYLRADLSLLQTAVGNFNVSQLQSTFNLLATTFVIPTINDVANKGMLIPNVEGVSFVNPELQFGTGYVLVSTDISYSPKSYEDISVDIDADYL